MVKAHNENEDAKLGNEKAWLNVQGGMMGVGLQSTYVLNTNNWAYKNLWYRDNIVSCFLHPNPGTYTYQFTPGVGINGEKIYDEMTKYKKAFVGFYPGQYTVEEKIDEEGNTRQVQITDTEQLAKLPTLNRGDKLYFAGLKYAFIQREHTKKGGEDDPKDYACIAECKAAHQCLFVRVTEGGIIVLNLGMPSSKTRQGYGSSQLVFSELQKFVKKVYLAPRTDPQRGPIPPFIAQNEDHWNEDDRVGGEDSDSE